MNVADDSADALGWLNERQRDGGVDRVQLPEGVRGELWLCGKRAAAARYLDPSWDLIVCLVEPHELAGHHREYLDWVRSGSGRVLWNPVPDLHAPELEAMQAVTVRIASMLASGGRVLVHCAAGFGRSGTVAGCVMIWLGMDADDALATVSVARPGAGPEAGAQRELVAGFRRTGSGDLR